MKFADDQRGEECGAKCKRSGARRRPERQQSRQACGGPNAPAGKGRLQGIIFKRSPLCEPDISG